MSNAPDMAPVSAGSAPAGDSGAPAETPQASPEDIEALIRDLEDPERRAELIRELGALREARARTQDGAESLGDLDLSILMERLGDRLLAWWHAVQQLDAAWFLQRLLWSLLVIIAAAVVYRLAQRGFRTLERRLAASTPQRHERRGIRLGERVIRTALILLALVILLQVWGLSLSEWATALASFTWVRAIVAMVLISAAALLLWSLSDTLISGAVAAQAQRLSDPRQRSRLRTVTPLLQGTVRMTIGVLALLLILAELGLNIGPLLAGAGIIGLAVGFGAQSLIKDLLIGVTLLLEDAASVGDVVNINGAVGEVEEMGIRMLRLRDLDGTMHLIPYSEISQVSNLTKDYAFALLDVRVAHAERVDDVIEALVETARTLRDDPDLGSLILEDLEVMGVNALADTGVEIRIRLKTLPLERWRIAREFRRRIKLRFDESGIEIPYPHRILYFGAEEASHGQRALRRGNADAD